jgi:hypothetical protein
MMDIHLVVGVYSPAEYEDDGYAVNVRAYADSHMAARRARELTGFIEAYAERSRVLYSELQDKRKPLDLGSGDKSEWAAWKVLYMEHSDKKDALLAETQQLMGWPEFNGEEHMTFEVEQLVLEV